jgi:flagellar motor switch protein FliG
MLYPRKPFDGFITIDDRSMQRVLREIDADDLALALKGASDAVKNKFFQNMSKKAAAMLKEDMEFMGAVKETSIIEARNKLLDIAVKLQGMGLVDGFGITGKYIN